MQNNNLEKSGHFKTSCVRLKLEVSHIFQVFPHKYVEILEDYKFTSNPKNINFITLLFWSTLFIFFICVITTSREVWTF